MERKFVFASLVYAVAGLILGIVMAATKDHSEHATHAHIMLVGFVLSFVYALMHRLWLDTAGSMLGLAQYYVHQLGAFGMSVGLFLLYGGFVEEAKVAPVLGLSSILVLLGVLMMVVMFFKCTEKA